MEIDFFGVVFSIKTESMDKVDKDVVHFLHTSHFFLKVSKSLGCSFSGKDLGIGFDFHHSGVDHGRGFERVDEISEFFVETEKKSII